MSPNSAKVRSSYSSPNGAQIISASDDKTIRIWDIHTGECIDSLIGHSAAVLYANYNSDGNRIISASADGTVRLWDKQTKHCLVLHGHQAPVYYASFSPDGKRVASISKDMTIKIWDATSGKCLHTLKGDKYQVVRTINFTKDSKRLVSVCQEKMIITWNVETGECINKCMPTSERYSTQHFYFDAEERYFDDREFLSAISSDGLTIAFVENHASEAFMGVYDTQTGNSFDDMTRTIKYGGREAVMGYIRSLSFGPLDDLLLVTTKDRIYGFYIPTGKCVYDTQRKVSTISGTETIDNSLTVIPNGNHIDITEMRVAPDLVSKETLPDGLFHRTTKPLLSPNGKLIAYFRPAEVDSDYIMICDVNNNIYHKIIKEGKLYCFSYDSKFIAWGNNTDILIQNTQTGAIHKRIAGSPANVTSACFSTDGKSIASSCNDLKIRIYDIGTGKCQHVLSGHSSDVLSASFSSDNKFILSASKDSTARIWDVRNGDCIRLFREEDKLDGAYFSRDNQLFATISKSGNFVHVRDVRSGKTVLTISISLNLFESNSIVSFSPNNQYIGIGNEIWNLKEKKRVNSFSEGFGSEELIGFDPNNDHLITLNEMEIRCWPFPPLQKLIDSTRERFKNRPLTPEERKKYFLEYE